MRGEHKPSILAYSAKRGSSPHARGAPTATAPAVASPRIIPACAGSTRTPPRPATPSRDHPRMRGEHLEGTLRMRGSEGSSPHARGAPRPRAPRAHRLGIIPACAGSTFQRLPGEAHWRDHPRMRGEHGFLGPGGRRRLGSSPHARGAPSRHIRVLQGIRIIPACAGSTVIYLQAYQMFCSNSFTFFARHGNYARH